MTRLKDFSSLFLLFFTATFFGQTSISGVVQKANNSTISGVEVYNTTTSAKTVSDENGVFTFEIKEGTTHQIVLYKDGFQLLEATIAMDENNKIFILETITNLSEVVIQNERGKLFNVNKLRDVEETAIYAGKKTEVIAVSKLTANKAVNNARQIFGQVVGLTINEGSDGGLQLSIGGRGLNPNRTSNFNTRQNGYDISADVLGYPESYYATPTEALEEIQIVRGAASLQYGTQFGGLVNFKIKSPSKKEMEITTRNTVGSYNLYTNFTSLSGTKGKFSYYTFFNFKQGDGFRPNSEFNSKSYFVNLNYQFNEKTSLHFDYTHFDYVAKQAGGLSDFMFNDDPNQSNRDRNWFAVNWNLYALRLKHKVSENADFSLQLFGLDASRKAVGYRSNRVSSPDFEGTVRDLVIGDFVNWGAEARFLQKHDFLGTNNAFLIGVKYYQSKNAGLQGPGSSGNGPDFSLATAEFPSYASQSNYEYPNLNVSLFGENIFRVSSKFSITPGFRYEKIRTQAEGYFRRINLDFAGNVILDERVDENNVKERDFLLLGVGLSYKLKNRLELYGNVSQNYRSVTFNDIRTVATGQVIAENITDEKGYTSDIGIRGQITDKVSFDASVFGLFYNDKIGEYDALNPDGSAAPVRLRDNIGTALTYGFEAMVDWNLSKTFFAENEQFSWNVFTNSALTGSEYLTSDVSNIEGNEVEFVPLINFKTGTSVGYRNFMTSLQLTYVTSQFTDASNKTVETTDNEYGIFGEIPSYYVADFSASYKWKMFKLEAGVTNFTNNNYFTRRATGYPGPGIIPSETRTFYTTLEFTF
ncbi:TonB-dependent receptor domain-containing protein [Flavobacterium sp. SM2513]|uniref:TonB-dependent receptor domain-containing protein n=1 Tax=Flavobacterium sp. SM2513 TaxID=3424766 RepID=UPI003D7F202A